MSDLPNPEEIARLRAIHCRPRGPVSIDGDVLTRVRRWTAEQSPGFRLIVRPERSIELTGNELHDAFAELTQGGAVIRQKGRRLAMESDREPAERLQRQFQEIAAQAWRLLDGRRCGTCKSYKIQIANHEKPPGWAIHCRDCCRAQQIIS